VVSSSELVEQPARANTARVAAIATTTALRILFW
jgi:hypothetical protein